MGYTISKEGTAILIEFKFLNYRSFRDEGCLSMEPMGLSRMKECLIPYRAAGLLPSVALFGKNGGGKTNVIRAFWFGVKFICNAQRTQHETAPIPVQPFLLDDVSQNEPTAFEFSYMLDNIKYVYGFAATKTTVVKEYLYHSPKGQKAMVFSRSGQDFEFREGPDKKKRELISETVAPNQLYFSVACTMNEKACMSAMRWFREQLLFSRDYTDLSDQLIEHSENPNMLQAIKRYAIEADLGIQDMKFEVKNTELTTADQLPTDLPEGIIAALKQFAKALSDDPNVSERKLQMGEVNVTSFHCGLDKEGQVHLYGLPLSVESDGTRQLMALAPAIEYVLSCGGVLLVDELENRIHPLLMQLIVSKFQSPKSNPNHAQLIFTTHNTELLDAGLIRKDQIYFVDKDKTSGSSSLYSISEFSTTTNENIRKGYLLGKYGAAPDLNIEV